MFAYPLLLILLAIPAGICAWIWRGGGAGQRVAIPMDGGIHPRRRIWGALLNLTASLPALLLALAILLLAGPQQFSEPKTKKKLTNIQFALDVSGSMTAPFGDGNRYDAAMSAINEFINYRESDAFGLTVFGDHFLHWIRLTSDPSAFGYATAFLGPKRLPVWFRGGTKIGMALEECLKLLVEREDGDRLVILVSDGYSADLGGGRDVEIASRLAANEITVYAIHVAPGAPPAQLLTISGRTGGEVFAAGDPEGLATIFRRIDEMQKTGIEKIAAESMDNFKPYSIAGAATLGLFLLSLTGLRYNPW
jgi:Ca-activated chloride channel family protein